MGGRFSKRPFKFSMWRCRGGDIGKRKVRGGIGRKGSGGGSVPKGAPFCCGEGGTAVCPSRGGDGFLFTCWGWYWKRKAPSWGVAVLSPQDSENTAFFSSLSVRRLYGLGALPVMPLGFKKESISHFLRYVPFQLPL